MSPNNTSPRMAGSRSKSEVFPHVKHIELDDILEEETPPLQDLLSPKGAIKHSSRDAEMTDNVTHIETDQIKENGPFNHDNHARNFLLKFEPSTSKF